jgi:hypothetical protein
VCCRLARPVVLLAELWRLYGPASLRGAPPCVLALSDCVLPEIRAAFPRAGPLLRASPLDPHHVCSAAYVLLAELGQA